MTARKMVNAVLKIVAGADYSGVSIAYPGPVKNEKPTQDPHNLAHGLVGFDFDKAFRKAVKIIERRGYASPGQL